MSVADSDVNRVLMLADLAEHTLHQVHKLVGLDKLLSEIVGVMIVRRFIEQERVTRGHGDRLYV